MPNWKHTIDCSGFWKDDSIPVPEKGQMLAKLLHDKVFKHYRDDWELEEIIESFECISGLEEIGVTEVEEFDDWLAALYDWANRDHRLWIQTRA